MKPSIVPRRKLSADEKKLGELVKALPEGQVLVRLPGARVVEKAGLIMISVPRDVASGLPTGPIIYYRRPAPTKVISDDRTEAEPGESGRWAAMIAFADALDRQASEQESDESDTTTGQPSRCNVYGRPQDLRQGTFGCASEHCRGYCSKAFTRNADGSVICRCDCRPGEDPFGGRSGAYGPLSDLA